MEYVRTFTREFDIGERADLRVDSRSGAVAVRGEETARARVEVAARLWAETDAEADDQIELISRNIRQDGPRLDIRVPALLQPSGFSFLFGRGPRVDYQITVPRQTEALLNSRSGRVDVDHIAGPLTIEARSGRVAINDIEANATLTVRSGSVQAERIGGSLSIDSRSGKVQVRGCKGALQVGARSGAIQVEDVRGDVRLETRSGLQTVSDIGGALYVRSTSGMVRYEGAVNGDFDIDVTSGAVVLAVDPQSVFFLDAETMAGSVYSDLPPREGAAGAAPDGKGPKVSVRTRSGSIRVVRR